MITTVIVKCFFVAANIAYFVTDTIIAVPVAGINVTKMVTDVVLVKKAACLKRTACPR